jgi:hypothetical protein
MAAYTELFVDQGTDFESSIDLVGDDGSPINVASYIFTGQIRKSYYSKNPAANISFTIVNAVGGNVKMTMSAGTTANIPAGRYLYDVKMIDSAATTNRLVEGIITINPQVTR